MTSRLGTGKPQTFFTVYIKKCYWKLLVNPYLKQEVKAWRCFSCLSEAVAGGLLLIISISAAVPPVPGTDFSAANFLPADVAVCLFCPRPRQTKRRPPERPPLQGGGGERGEEERCGQRGAAPPKQLLVMTSFPAGRKQWILTASLGGSRSVSWLVASDTTLTINLSY